MGKGTAGAHGLVYAALLKKQGGLKPILADMLRATILSTIKRSGMMTAELMKEYFKKLDENIRQKGYQLTYVSSSNSPAFCYSTGLYRTYNIPELFISALPQGLCSEIVENYVKAFKDKKALPINELLNFLTSRFPVYLIEVPILNLQDYVLSSIKVYETEVYEYLQVIYPDISGNFPNDTGYDYDQEVMAEFRN